MGMVFLRLPKLKENLKDLMDLEWLTGCQQRQIGFEQSFAPKFGGLFYLAFLQRLLLPF